MWWRTSLCVAVLGVALYVVDHQLFCHTFPPPPKRKSDGRLAILVTGASSGIGEHIVLTLANESSANNIIVFATCRSLDAARRLPNNGRIVPLIMDVTDPASIEDAVTKVEAVLLADKNESIPLVGLINNAGVSKPAHTRRASILARDVFEVNVFGVLQVTEVFLPLLMRAGRGSRVVNMGSIAGLTHRANDVAYTGSKHALEGINDVMRLDLLPLGISVSLVEPGFVRSGLCTQRSSNASHCRNGPNVTTAAIRHALFSERPRTRYFVSDFFGLPAWLVGSLAGVLPARIMDFLIMKLAA